MAAAGELAEAAHLHRGQIVVVGCSTSEVVGKKVGSWSTPEVADAIFEGLHSVFAPMGVYIAAQCCEHLNRALIVEEEAARAHRLEVRQRRPPAQGGRRLCHCGLPVRLSAPGGGGAGSGPRRRTGHRRTRLIGMHLRPVAVPVRLSLQGHIGQTPFWSGGADAAPVHRRRARPLRRDTEGGLSGVLGRQLRDAVRYVV